MSTSYVTHRKEFWIVRHVSIYLNELGRKRLEESMPALNRMEEWGIHRPKIGLFYNEGCGITLPQLYTLYLEVEEERFQFFRVDPDGTRLLAKGNIGEKNEHDHLKSKRRDPTPTFYSKGDDGWEYHFHVGHHRPLCSLNISYGMEECEQEEIEV